MHPCPLWHDRYLSSFSLILHRWGQQELFEQLLPLPGERELHPAAVGLRRGSRLRWWSGREGLRRPPHSNLSAGAASMRQRRLSSGRLALRWRSRLLGPFRRDGLHGRERREWGRQGGSGMRHGRVPVHIRALHQGRLPLRRGDPLPGRDGRAGLRIRIAPLRRGRFPVPGRPVHRSKLAVFAIAADGCLLGKCERHPLFALFVGATARTTASLEWMRRIATQPRLEVAAGPNPAAPTRWPARQDPANESLASPRHGYGRHTQPLTSNQDMSFTSSASCPLSLARSLCSLTK